MISEDIMIKACIFFAFSLYGGIAVEASTVVVDSPIGKIQGARKTDKNTALSYLSFRGIPYAKPPVGNLRFAKPETHPKFDGVFDASKDTIIRCPVPTFLEGDKTNFQEDCLVLYIVTKDIQPSNELKKVIMFIHGGGFLTGEAGSHDIKTFVTSQDVVYVAMNYRLGVLGFLSTENEASPGNYGLWDQNLAIKWVKNNIRAFGGDPDDITIAGESAGGRAVGFHAVSPHSKGLFTKAYLHSGTASGVFARSIDAQAHALAVAKLAGCWDDEDDRAINVTESKAIVQCLRKAPLSDITAFSDFSLSKTLFVTVVDGDFIPDIVTNLVQDDHYLQSVGFFDRSYLIAVNNEEQVAYENYFSMVKLRISSNSESSDAQKELMYQAVLGETRTFYLNSRLGETLASDKNIVSKIDDFYTRRFQGDKVLAEMISDLNYLIPSLDFLAAASRHKSCSPYFLYFDYYPKYMKGKYKGTPHALDLVYWFDQDINDYEKESNVGIQGLFTSEDIELKRSFSSLVGGFVKTGNPGVSLKKILPSGWPKYDVTNSFYLNFNSKPWVSSFLDKAKQDLWFGTVPNNLMTKSVIPSPCAKQFLSPLLLAFCLCFLYHVQC